MLIGLLLEIARICHQSISVVLFSFLLEPQMSLWQKMEWIHDRRLDVSIPKRSIPTQRKVIGNFEGEGGFKLKQKFLKGSMELH